MDDFGEKIKAAEGEVLDLAEDLKPKKKDIEILPPEGDDLKRRKWLAKFQVPQNLKTKPITRAMVAALQHNDCELLRDLIYSAIKHAIDGDARFFEMIIERIDGKLIAQAVGAGLTSEELEAVQAPQEKLKLIVDKVRGRIKPQESQEVN
jgi:hypothetical protein